MHFQGDSAFDPLGHAFSVAVPNNTRPMIIKAKTRLIGRIWVESYEEKKCENRRSCRYHRHCYKITGAA